MRVSFISTTVNLYNLPVKKKRPDFETYFKTLILSNIIKQNKTKTNLY
jgi:hypothetical protein